MKYKELSKQININEQDISFDEFKNYLSGCGQLESFESYLTRQSNLPYEKQALIYRLICPCTLDVLPREILIEVFKNMPLQDLLQARSTSKFLKRICDDVISSLYPNVIKKQEETIVQAVIRNEKKLKMLRISKKD